MLAASFDTSDPESILGVVGPKKSDKQTRNVHRNSQVGLLQSRRIINTVSGPV
jgi:hypothetical protein